MQAQKYLDRHAEPEAQSVAPGATSADVFDYALVLPCYDEAPTDIERIATFCVTNNALLILVVNQPEAVDSCDQNAKVLEWASREITTLSQHVQLCRAGDTRILLIDRTRQRIPAAQGVGLARKIGADCAFALIMQGVVKSPWIFSTDADAILPPDYFTATANLAGNSAVIYPFRHVACDDSDIDINTATALYELRLHHYVAGLQRAGSPYAFHTLGSTLAIHAPHYAAAHGFPKRAGGEDFYLLNKLAKLAPIKSPSQPVLQLRARASHRVPFGTGPAVTKLAGSEDMLRQPLFYHAESFELLRCWLDFLALCSSNLIAGKPATQWRSWLQEHANTNGNTLLQSVDAGEFEAMLYKALRQCRDTASLQRYLYTWFDGFRTLKFLHALRDNGFPLQNFLECFGNTNGDGDGLLDKITTLNTQLRDSLTKN